MTAYIVINSTKPEAVPVAADAIRILQDDGIRCVVVNSEYNPCYGSEVTCVTNTSAALDICDFVITVGGDGTILHAVAHFGALKKPILGINLGRMGFMATLEPTELVQLHRLAMGEYVLDERSLLCATLEDGSRYTALNDMVIAKEFVSHTIHYSIYCDDTLVNSYRGDGVVIATPTGSTAYSLSAGGPILDARSNGFVVTPICAHSINTPSMVFATERKLKIVVSENDQCAAYFSSDGTNNIRLCSMQMINIEQASYKVSLISFGEADQFKMIDKKLKGR